MTRILFGGVCLAAAMLAPPALADEACHLQRAAIFAMSTDDAGGVSVPMTIAGHTVNLLIDTGGVDSMLTESTVKVLGLATGRLRDQYVEGYGGYTIDSFAQALDVDFGGLKAPRKQFLIMPDAGVPPGVNGTLAPDILRAYDDDFDFANATFNLVSPDHCPGQVVYWTQGEHSEIPFQLDRTGHVRLMVKMDGADFRVDFDTGFSRSIMGLDEARILFHFNDESPDLKEVHEPGFAHAYRYPFKNLTFGGVTIRNPDILLIPESDSRIDGAIIGIGVLRQLHLYIAYKEKKMYVTPAGAR